MEELIHKYLSKNYYLKDVIGWDIYCIESNMRKDELARELASIFSITRDEGRIFTNNWANNIEPDIDLHLYWFQTTKEQVYQFNGFKSPGVHTIESDFNLVERNRELAEAGIRLY